MVTQKCIDVLTFDELNEEAQAEALDAVRYFHVEDEYWWNAAFNGNVDQFKAAGVALLDSRTSKPDWNHDQWYGGFDGYAIHFATNPDWLTFAADVDLPTFMRHTKIAGKYRALYNAAVADLAWADISHSTTWRRDGSMEARVEGPSALSEQIGIVQEYLQDWACDIAGEMINSMRLEYEYLTSDEHALWCMEGNQYVFDANGRLQ